MSDKMPEEVPILTENDICKRRLRSLDGRRRCLIGWRDTIEPAQRNVVYGAICDAIRESIPQIDPKKKLCVPDFNDSRPKAVVAKIWNRAMYLLGYTVGNPQKKPVRVLRGKNNARA